MLKKGKAKSLLSRSIDCALLAVEIYNKPRAPFRVQSYVSHMIMAWTKLFHAYFYKSFGDKFYYKDASGKYRTIDGKKGSEKKAWDLSKSIKEYNKYTQKSEIKEVPVNEDVVNNLDFFIQLRNKIEHKQVDKDEIGLSIFGECQSLLYNYENLLIHLFGEEYALNESLAYSLQFSRVRTQGQKEASKKLLSNEVKDVKSFIDNYRANLSDEVYQSQNFSVKLIQIPKISNTDRGEVAIEFVNWSNLSESDKENYEQVYGLIKEKKEKKEPLNPDRLKPSQIVDRVNQQLPFIFNSHDHKCLFNIFSVRPTRHNQVDLDPEDTITKFCHYDEAHQDYLYEGEWIEFIVALYTSHGFTQEQIRNYFRKGQRLDYREFLIE
jgi:hypothetical protein